MAQIKRLGRPSKERNAVTRNQATDLLWTGKITTTVAKAKALRSYAEKILTKAINLAISVQVVDYTIAL